MTLRILRLILALAPRRFRQRMGTDWLAVVAARAGEPRGPLESFVMGIREIAGACRMVGGLHLDARATGHGRGGANMMETMMQDLRFGLRSLRRNRGFTISAVLVLGLGIGANTAIFSAANAFFFRPLPFDDADKLVTVFETNPDFGWTDATAAPANVFDWRSQVDAFQDVSAYSEFVNEWTAFQDGRPRVIGATSVLGNFFSTLGVAPLMGRTFTVDETWSDSEPVVVVSYGLWQSHFGGDANVVGRRLERDGASPVVIGVMPETFGFPSDRTQLWYPARWDREAMTQTWFRRAHIVRAFARLAPGVDLAEADAQLQVVVDRLQVEYPVTNSVMGAGIAPMRDFLIRGVRTQLLVLLGAVALLLLLACTNVANLLLVRASDRAREVALRQALGAGRWRVARQIVTESSLITLGGALVGLGIGWLGVRALTFSEPLGIEGATSVALDHRVLLFTTGLAVSAGLFFGAVPILRNLSGDIDMTLRDGSLDNRGGRRALRAADLLVAAEVAIALVLVVGAGLMVRTFSELRAVNPGFDPEGVVAVRFNVPSARYQNRGEVLAFYDQLVEGVEARPNVLRAGTVGSLPVTQHSWSSSFQAEGWPPDRVGYEIVHRRADADYFAAIGTPLIRGRLFEATDGPDDPLVVVVNESFVDEHFPGEDPIGQRIAYDSAPGPDSNWYLIVGIVGDQHQASLSVPVAPEVFENRNQDWGRDSWVVVRGDTNDTGLFSAIGSVLAELDPMIPISASETLSGLVDESMAREAFLLKLLTIFGIVALLLASVGVYGVTAQAALRRTQEIGIRMALGAAAPDVLRMMLRHGIGVAVVGLAVGLVGALASTRLLTSVLDPMLFGVKPTDPLTLGAVVVLLGSVAVLASYLPARRATAVDPVQSLRAE